jgi:hypothetical protein
VLFRASRTLVLEDECSPFVQMKKLRPEKDNGWPLTKHPHWSPKVLGVVSELHDGEA